MRRLKEFFQSDFINNNFVQTGELDDLILFVCTFMKRCLNYGMMHGDDSDTFEGVGNLEIDDSHAAKLLVIYYQCAMAGLSPECIDFHMYLYIMKTMQECRLTDKELSEIITMRLFLDYFSRISRESIKEMKRLAFGLCSRRILTFVIKEMDEIDSGFMGN